MLLRSWCSRMWNTECFLECNKRTIYIHIVCFVYTLLSGQSIVYLVCNSISKPISILLKLYFYFLLIVAFHWLSLSANCQMCAFRIEKSSHTHLRKYIDSEIEPFIDWTRSTQHNTPNAGWTMVGSCRTKWIVCMNGKLMPLSEKCQNRKFFHSKDVAEIAQLNEFVTDFIQPVNAHNNHETHVCATFAWAYTTDYKKHALFG